MIVTSLPIPVQVVDPTSGVVLASNIAEIIIAAAILVMTIVAVVSFHRFNRLLSDLDDWRNRELAPISDRARVIAENVEYVSQVIRSDVEGLNHSVRALGERLEEAAEMMEVRVEEFNALLEVIQGEAEDVFLDAASTVRGVRAGARAISSRRRMDDLVGEGPEALPRSQPAPSEEAPAPSAAERSEEHATSESES